jgi:hypothetical protein
MSRRLKLSVEIIAWDWLRFGQNVTRSGKLVHGSSAENAPSQAPKIKDFFS